MAIIQIMDLTGRFINSPKKNESDKLWIEDDTNLHRFISDALISQATVNTSTHQCCHCGCPIRYPIIARKSDIEAFSKLMKSAYRIMDKHGITANLLADIRADIAISIAKEVK